MGSHAVTTPGEIAPPAKTPLYRLLYVQVLVAIALGAAVGHFAPEFGAGLKPLGDAFIKLVKMVIAPVIFLTIVVGIAGMRDIGKVGRRLIKIPKPSVSLPIVNPGPRRLQGDGISLGQPVGLCGKCHRCRRINRPADGPTIINQL